MKTVKTFKFYKVSEFSEPLGSAHNPRRWGKFTSIPPPHLRFPLGKSPLHITSWRETSCGFYILGAHAPSSFLIISCSVLSCGVISLYTRTVCDLFLLTHSIEQNIRIVCSFVSSNIHPYFTE